MGANLFIDKNTGVIVVDLQADFTELKSGSLAVPATDADYIEAVETATRGFLNQGRCLYFTQDWRRIIASKPRL